MNTKIVLLMFCLGTLTQTAKAQCIKLAQWPPSIVTAPNASGLVDVISANHKTTDFAIIDNIMPGHFYEFTSSTETDYITLRDIGAGVDFAFGPSPLVVAIPSFIGPSIEMHLGADMLCNRDDYLRATTISCLSCTPVNDNCSNALELVVEEELTCQESRKGFLGNANTTNFISACVAANNRDIWYQFEATHTTHVLQFSPLGASAPYNFEIFDGICGGLSTTNCGFATSQEINGLTIGNTYTIRIFEDNMLPPGMNNFLEICIGTYKPPCDVYLDPITTATAQLNWTAGEGQAVSTSISLCLKGDTPETATCQTFTDTDGSPHFFTNLMECTDYDVFLEEQYASGGKSLRAGPFTFQTDGLVNTNPICGDVVRYPPCPETTHHILDDITFNICPSGGERMRITFTYFDLEASIAAGLDGNGCWDYIEVFDDAVSLGTFCSETDGDNPNNTSPINPAADLSINPVFMASTPGTCLSFTLYTDGIIQETGIEFTVDCIDACPNNLYIGSNILSETYPAKMKVCSDGTVNNGENVTMEGLYIELNAGFEVKLGAEYLGHIDPCN